MLYLLFIFTNSYSKSLFAAALYCIIQFAHSWSSLLGQEKKVSWGVRHRSPSVTLEQIHVLQGSSKNREKCYFIGWTPTQVKVSFISL